MNHPLGYSVCYQHLLVASNHANHIKHKSDGESSRCSFQERPGITISQLMVELWRIPMRNEHIARRSWTGKNGKEELTGEK
jgi:hypothetical protein